MFSDESHFYFLSNSCRIWVWHGRGNRFKPSGVVEHPTMQQWGIIAYHPRLLLVHNQGIMIVQRYVYDMLQLVTLPYLEGVLYAFYQQDNALPHTAYISQCVLQSPWPAYSPDRSPFEQILGCLFFVVVTLYLSSCILFWPFLIDVAFSMSCSVYLF